MKKIKNKRITQPEKELRLYQVYHMVLNGFPRYKIIVFGDKTWGACTRTMDGYISEVSDMMNDMNTKNYQYNLNLMNCRIEDLINKCYTENDKKTMVQLLKLQADILGINATSKVDITSNGETIRGTTINVTIKEEDDE